MKRQTDLLQVVHALGASGGLASGLDGGKQQCDHDRARARRADAGDRLTDHEVQPWPSTAIATEAGNNKRRSSAARGTLSGSTCKANSPPALPAWRCDCAIAAFACWSKLGTFSTRAGIGVAGITDIQEDELRGKAPRHGEKRTVGRQFWSARPAARAGRRRVPVAPITSWLLANHHGRPIHLRYRPGNAPGGQVHLIPGVRTRLLLELKSCGVAVRTGGFPLLLQGGIDGVDQRIDCLSRGDLIADLHRNRQPGELREERQRRVCLRLSSGWLCVKGHFRADVAEQVPAQVQVELLAPPASRSL